MEIIGRKMIETFSKRQPEQRQIWLNHTTDPTTPPHQHTSTPPNHHTTKPPNHQTTTPPHHHTTTPPHHHATLPPHHHTTTTPPPRHHTAKPSLHTHRNHCDQPNHSPCAVSARRNVVRRRIKSDVTRMTKRNLRRSFRLAVSEMIEVKEDFPAR